MINNPKATINSSKTAKQSNPWATLFFAIGALHLYGMITKSSSKSSRSILLSPLPDNGGHLHANNSGALMSRYLTVTLLSAFIAGVMELFVFSTF